MTTATLPPPQGSTYCAQFDAARLGAQCQRVLTLMLDGQIRTLREIAAITGDPEASISARLRQIRHAEINGANVYDVEKRRRGDPSLGIWEYKVWRL